MDISQRFLSAVNDAISYHLGQITQKTDLEDVTQFIEPLVDFTAGGKRGRARLVALGTRLMGRPIDAQTIQLATALEFFQAWALVHDDLIDRAETRRGKPALHISYRQHMRAHIADSAAILAGDLCAGLAETALADANASPALLTQWAQMSTEVAFGQYLDTRLQECDNHDLERSLQVIRHKSANYSVVYPLTLGMVHAGGSAEQVQALKDAALPLGEAFQLRDDHLGVFGDEKVTGKPSGADLIEGKKTVLMALFAAKCPGAPQLNWLGAPLTDAQLQEFRSALIESGAVGEHEEMIRVRAQQFRRALLALNLDADASQSLLQLATQLVDRES